MSTTLPFDLNKNITCLQRYCKSPPLGTLMDPNTLFGQSWVHTNHQHIQMTQVQYWERLNCPCQTSTELFIALKWLTFCPMFWASWSEKKQCYKQRIYKKWPIVSFTKICSLSKVWTTAPLSTQMQRRCAVQPLSRIFTPSNVETCRCYLDPGCPFRQCLDSCRGRRVLWVDRWACSMNNTCCLWVYVFHLTPGSTVKLQQAS